MNDRAKICVVTGSRADYGLLHWLMSAIAADPDLGLQVIATGSHLSLRHGETIQEIQRDGFSIDASVAILSDDDSRLATVVATAKALRGIGESLHRLSPDIVVVLGDRYEILAAAEAAFILGIPVAHIHGGEVTEGAMDDAFRHAMTKFAQLHFVAANLYRDRVVQMGEDPAQVYVVGALGVESVHRVEPLEVDELDRRLGLPISDPLLLVTYHPVTAGSSSSLPAVHGLIAALEAFPKARIVVTGVNADPGNQIIQSALMDFAARHPHRVSLHDSLGMRAYLSVMRRAAVVVGNSSSGILEAPAAGVPTVDIGSRQAGRIKAASVLACAESTADITAAIRMALDPDFRAKAKSQNQPYGDGRASERMLPILKSFAAHPPGAKRFHDIAVA